MKKQHYHTLFGLAALVLYNQTHSNAWLFISVAAFVISFVNGFYKE